MFASHSNKLPQQHVWSHRRKNPFALTTRPSDGFYSNDGRTMNERPDASKICSFATSWKIIKKDLMSFSSLEGRRDVKKQRSASSVRSFFTSRTHETIRKIFFQPLMLANLNAIVLMERNPGRWKRHLGGSNWLLRRKSTIFPALFVTSVSPFAIITCEKGFSSPPSSTIEVKASLMLMNSLKEFYWLCAHNFALGAFPPPTLVVTW